MKNAVDTLYAEGLRLTSVDLRLAGRKASQTLRAAQRAGTARELGLAHRLQGHVAFLRSRHRQAVTHYETAVEWFAKAGLPVEEAVTRSGAIVALIYLAQYSVVADWAGAARAVFAAEKDRARLARLDGNLAFAAFRQDRFAEAYALYCHVLEEFRAVGRPVDISTALWNVCTCLISMGEYAEAGRANQEARQYAQQHGLPLQTAAIDYNVAYLHYLCGDYVQAMELYAVARQTGQPYRRALCDLDEAEMFLELNLHRESALLARKASRQFRRLQMPYEQGKAMAFLAIAEGQLGQFAAALQRIRAARRTFQQDRNPVWLALLDLYEAILLHRKGDGRRAREAAEHAAAFFANSDFPAKAATCELLLARLELAGGQAKAGLRRVRALAEAEAVRGSAALAFQAAQLEAELLEAVGQPRQAAAAYRQALVALERLRYRLRGDEIKVAFLKDKLCVFENLFWLTVTGNAADRVEQAFALAERAKSRSMTEQLRHGPGPADASGELAPLRQELDLLYQQIQREELQGSSQQAAALRQRAWQRETTLAGRLAAQQALRGKGRAEGEAERAADRADASSPAWPGGAGREAAGSLAWLPPNLQLLEYFVAQKTLFVFLASRSQLRVWPLAALAPVEDLVRRLRLQIAAPGGSQSLAEAHLRQLYEILVAPVAEHLTAEELAIVPHGVLHSLPFGALHDGKSSLLERFAITYAPSAELLQLSGRPKAEAAPAVEEGEGFVIMAVADAQAPLIAAEAARLSSRFPRAQCFQGAAATAANLRQQMARARILHLATHGYFRRENPLFSSLQLQDSRLTVFDLYQLQTPAELVTLSGCSTGLNAVVGADELMGLVRGVLLAGAASALVSLWDVHDASAAELMEEFYGLWLQGGHRPAQALRRACLQLRERYPAYHHWAAFSLVGLGQSPEPGAGEKS